MEEQMNKANDKLYLFESMPVPKAIFTMVIPTVISQIITLIYNLSDTFFIGRTGDSYMLAGMSVCYTIVILAITFNNLFGVGAGTLISRLDGKGQHDRARIASTIAFYGVITAAVIYSIVIWIFLDPILYALGASSLTIDYARQYAMIVVVAGTLPSILSTTIAHLLRNVGYSKQASIGLSGGGILNIILDPLFMFVILPEGQEVFGAAIATLISNSLACIFLLYQFFKLSRTTSLCSNVKILKKAAAEDLKNVLMSGLPSALLFCLFDIANMFMFSLMSQYSDLSIAAIGMVVKIERLPTQVGVAIAQSLMPLISYSYGSKNFTRMSDIINRGRIYGIITTLSCVILYQIFAEPLCNFFLSTTGGYIETSLVTISLAVTYLRIRSVASPLMFLNYHSSFALQAMGSIKRALIHTCIRVLVLTIPFLHLFDHFWHDSGLCAALPASESISCIIALLLLSSRVKTILKTKNEKAL